MAPSQPSVVSVAAGDAGTSPVLSRWIADLRGSTTAAIFLSGGASKIDEATRQKVLELFGALSTLARSGVKILVGDGGTQAGIMEAAGVARRQSGNAFPLIGVAPAEEILPAGGTGRTAVDPNHSHLVAVSNPAWLARAKADGWNPQDGYWGSETSTMFGVFDRLAAGRPSVAIVANGGAIALDEVAANVRAGRPIVVIAGSGRAADALASLLRDRTSTDSEVTELRAKAHALGLPGRPELFQLFDLNAGADALAQLLRQQIDRAG